MNKEPTTERRINNEALLKSAGLDEQSRISYLESQLGKERDLIADLLQSEAALRAECKHKLSIMMQLRGELHAVKQELLKSQQDYVALEVIDDVVRDDLKQEIADAKQAWSNSQTRVMELEFENRALRKALNELVYEEHPNQWTTAYDGDVDVTHIVGDYVVRKIK